MELFHAAPAHAPPDGLLSGVQRVVNGDLQRCVPPSDDDAGESAQDNLHGAFLVDSAAGAVGIPCPHRHPLD